MNLLMKGSGGITQVPLESKMLQERHIFIEGEIRPEMAVRFLKQMMYLNMEDTDPVSVYINSPGGEVNSGFLMYDVIVGSRAPVRMFCTGSRKGRSDGQGGQGSVRRRTETCLRAG